MDNELFTKMALKAKKEAPAPHKAEAKAKALMTKKTVLKGVHSHKKRSACHPPSEVPRHCGSEAAQISWEESPQEKQA